MKTDKYWASNPDKNGSYVDKGRVEGRPVAAATLKDEAPTSKVTFKLMYKNTKDKKYCD
jgi:hypothetical protein